MNIVNERFLWAVDVMDLQPADKILEIGCGTGILVSEIASKLTKGSITAIDRSAPMVAKAVKRNKLFMEQGRIKFKEAAFEEYSDEEMSFDKIVAFNVSCFVKDPHPAIERVRKLLKPKGELYAFYQMPYEITPAAAKPLADILEENSLVVKNIVFKKLKPVSAFGIIAELKTL